MTHAEDQAGPLRIAVVTAHYPPNFVSGGTLVPQRLARGLAARGHRIAVFAGALDHAEPDLWRWTEADEPGVTIHWLATTGFLDWASDRNFSNPLVERAFAEFLDEFRPDVVHFHSMQGLGGGLVPLAAATGAATVITMHDLWWWCGRQFLVEKDMRPCSMVVDCGVCPCERGNDWLVRRDRGLAAQLDRADLVLAPSETMLTLLAANGVDPARLVLDENSVDRAETEGTASLLVTATERAADEPVRFVYAGGPHPLKGADVVTAAARSLTDLPGWELDLYGMDLPRGLPAAVSARPPYPAAEVDRVLSGYDVLLMPSVASESYSLITREALRAGCAVITGDSPGPMEVIQDGTNGLVVPRGDSAALAAAMRSLVNDSRLLATLRSAPYELRLRTSDDQLDGLEAHFRRLLRRPPDTDTDTEIDTGPARGPIRRVLLLTGIGAAPLRYRGRLPQEALAGLGVRMDVHHYRDVEVPRLARLADAVVVYRVPATDQLLDLIRMIRDRPEPVPVLYDVDDLVFDPAAEPELRETLAHLTDADRRLYWEGVRRYRTSLEAADGFVGSTQTLLSEVARLVPGMPTYRFANGVGLLLARVSDAEVRRDRAPGPLRIGYFSGTNTHNEDWAHIEPAVAAVLADRTEAELWVGGLLNTGPALDPYADRIRRMPLKPWSELPGLLRDLDVNLAPLTPGSRFNEAKSAIKWLEAALVGTPTVASPTQPFREAVVDGRTGLLADSVLQWWTAIGRLLDDEALRRRMGQAARNAALLDLSPARQGHRYLAILEQARDRVVEHGHREATGGWAPETLSEPYFPVAAEPYAAPAGSPAALTPEHAGPRNLRRVAVDYRVNAVNHLRTEGPVRTARKAVAVLAHLPGRVAGRRSR